MSDFGGIANAAVQLHDELKQAQRDVKQREQQKAEEATRAFQVAMDDMRKTRETERVKYARAVSQKALAADVLNQARDQASSAMTTQFGQTQVREQHRLFEMFKKLIAGQDKMGEIIKEAMSGKQFSPPDILQMQCAVFRYAQELEFSVKAVEKADNGVKQILNQQMG